MLRPGDPAPWFECRTEVNPRFTFDSAAGRYLVLSFLGRADDDSAQQTLAAFSQHEAVFDGEHAALFHFCSDPSSVAYAPQLQKSPATIAFWDFDARIAQLYDVCDQAGKYTRCCVLLDPRLRVVAVIPFEADAAHVEKVIQALSALPAVAELDTFAPILIVPRIFEPEVCRELILRYEQHGGRESGFMREVEGRTVEVMDSGFKRRKDLEISEEPLIRALHARLVARLVPEIHKSFQFQATRIERNIVSCYEAEIGGHFRPHRDNTTKGTAHRRFAVSLNLNSEEYEGCDLRFPEFGRRTYRAPTGGAVVFSCSLLHEATPMTRGRRYAFLPFLYDDAAAKVRQANLQYIGNTPEPSAPS